MLVLAAIICAGIAAILLLLAQIIDQLGKIKMDQATILANLAALKAAVETLINRPVPPQEDLQPVADAIAAIQAEVDAKNAS